MHLGLIIATTVIRFSAAWLAFRLYRRHGGYRFAIVTFVLAVTALFPLVEIANPPNTFFREWLPTAASGLAMLLTAMILVRTLAELMQALEQIRAANDRLEQRVADRTAELRAVNESLQNEIAERKRAEEALLASEAELRRSEVDLRKLAARLIAAQEEERKRLARELHDDLSQSLAALALEIANLRRAAVRDPDSAAGRLAGVESTVHRLADDIHDISRLLHPSILDDLGLEAAVRTECERFNDREGIQVDFRASNVPPSLDDQCALTFYRVAQESLRNIAKHSHATEAFVELEGDEDDLRLTVRDGGVGFDVTEARERLGLGLVSMSERVRLLTGSIEIDSAPGRGTSIRIAVPLERNRNEQTARIAC